MREGKVITGQWMMNFYCNFYCNSYGKAAAMVTEDLITEADRIGTLPCDA